MATPPSIRQITRELLGDVPGWLDRLLQPLNQFLQQTGDALSNNLTPSQNLAQCWLALTVTAVDTRTIQEVPLQALPRLKGRTAYGVSVERVSVASGTLDWFPSVDWSPASVEGKPAIQIHTVYGLNAGAVATLTLLVKAE